MLAWMRAGDEEDIRNAFDETTIVSKLGPEARTLADRYFFAALVRIHRAGEGSPVMHAGTMFSMA